MEVKVMGVSSNGQLGCSWSRCTSAIIVIEATSHGGVACSFPAICSFVWHRSGGGSGVIVRWPGFDRHLWTGTACPEEVSDGFTQALHSWVYRQRPRFEWTLDPLHLSLSLSLTQADCFSIQLGTGRRRQTHFDARVVLIDVFVEVGFDDAVVVDAESLTEGILRDLESAIDVSS
jgi:hypothetical protein